MALVYLYKNLLPGETLAGNQLKVTRNAFNIFYNEPLCDVGEMEFSISAKDSFCDYIKEDYLVCIDGYFGIIRNQGASGHIRYIAKFFNSVIYSCNGFSGYAT